MPLPSSAGAYPMAERIALHYRRHSARPRLTSGAFPMGWIILLSVCLAPVAHLVALIVARQGKSRLHAAAFWGAVAGLLSVPAAILAFVAALPYSIAGAGDHPITWILPATWVALWALTAWSIVASSVAWRRRTA